MNQNVSLPFEMVLPIKNSIKYTLDVQDVAKRKISTRFTLKIKEPSKLDNGFYNCTVQNQFGSGNYNFEIRRRGTFAEFSKLSSENKHLIFQIIKTKTVIVC
jgi:hypothetical protein